MKKLYFIGSGKMASAIAGGLVANNVFTADELGAFDPDCKAAELFSNSTGIAVDTDSPECGIKNADTILIAVKPQMITIALEPYYNILKNKALISIAAGVSIAKLQEITGSSRIIRVMPNTPALVGKGVSAYTVSEKSSCDDIALADRILSAIGIVIKTNETDLDAVTALSGSGPAYVFEFIQALADGGVAEGLPRATAQLLAAQTVLGAAEMVLKTGEHPISLKDKVTSPAGTTSRALEELSFHGFSGIVIKAMRACAKRSRELGKN